MMTVCRRCGDEFTESPRASLSELSLRVLSYPLRRPFGYFAAGFLVSGMLMIVSAFALIVSEQGPLIWSLALLVLTVSTVVLVGILFGRMLRSEADSRYCPSCRAEIRLRKAAYDIGTGPHKVATKKR